MLAGHEEVTTWAEGGFRADTSVLTAAMGYITAFAARPPRMLIPCTDPPWEIARLLAVAGSSLPWSEARKLDRSTVTLPDASRFTAGIVFEPRMHHVAPP